MFIQIELRKVILIILILAICIEARRKNCIRQCYGDVQCIANCEFQLEFKGKPSPPHYIPQYIVSDFIEPIKSVKSITILKGLPDHCGLRHIAVSKPSRTSYWSGVVPFIVGGA